MERISAFVSIFNVVISTSVSIDVKKKRSFLSFQKASSMKKPSAQTLTLWEYVFGRKKFSKNPYACQLVNHPEQTCYEKSSCYQATPGDISVYTDPVKSSKDLRGFVEPQSKPPLYKLPRAVLLCRVMEGFSEVTKSSYTFQLYFCYGYLSRSENH